MDAVSTRLDTLREQTRDEPWRMDLVGRPQKIIDAVLLTRAVSGHTDPDTAIPAAVDTRQSYHQMWDQCRELLEHTEQVPVIPADQPTPATGTDPAHRTAGVPFGTPDPAMTPAPPPTAPACHDRVICLIHQPPPRLEPPMLSDLFNDIFDADPVPTFLVWGPWAWTGMVVLLVVFSALAWLVTGAVTRESSSVRTAIAVTLNFFNGLFIHAVMRHLEQRWAVYLLAVVAFVLACWLLASLEASFGGMSWCWDRWPFPSSSTVWPVTSRTYP